MRFKIHEEQYERLEKTLLKSNMFKSKGFDKIVLATINQEIDSINIPYTLSGLIELDRVFRNNHSKKKNIFDKEKVEKLMVHISKQKKTKKIFNEEKYIIALLETTKYESYWIRDIETWTPKTHNTHNQVVDILRHLFIKYPIPSFMYNAWLNNNIDEIEIDWFLYMSEGNNIRKSDYLPFDLTSKRNPPPLGGGCDISFVFVVLFIS